MKANVYALMEVRGRSSDLYAVWGTFREALDHYARIKGYRLGYEPADVVQESIADPVTGDVRDVWTFDKDASGWTWIAQYEVPLSEFL